jgi:hypothetical protein
MHEPPRHGIVAKRPIATSEVSTDSVVNKDVGTTI